MFIVGAIVWFYLSICFVVNRDSLHKSAISMTGRMLTIQGGSTVNLFCSVLIVMLKKPTIYYRFARLNLLFTWNVV